MCWGLGVLVGRRAGAGVLKGSVALAKMERRMDTKPTCMLLRWLSGPGVPKARAGVALHVHAHE